MDHSAEALLPIPWIGSTAGKSGRRKLDVVDWDADGDLDLIADTDHAAWSTCPEQRVCSSILTAQGS